MKKKKKKKLENQIILDCSLYKYLKHLPNNFALDPNSSSQFKIDLYSPNQHVRTIRMDVEEQQNENEKINEINQMEENE